MENPLEKTSNNPFLLEKIHSVFSKTMEKKYRTYLRGGGAEPIYIPPNEEQYGVIQYTQDYPRSALHELAHWCVAGPERRTQEDYGYWYVPDGRNEAQQKEFYQVEVKPQALEYLFCKACGIPFQVSVDNLEGSPGKGEAFFENAVMEQVAHYLGNGLPERAKVLQKYLEGVEIGSKNDTSLK